MLILGEDGRTLNFTTANEDDQLAPKRNILQCSKSCGTGIQTRRVECTMRRGNHGPEIPVKDEQCFRSKSRKPKSQRLCQRVACDFIWQEGTWSEVFLYLNLMPILLQSYLLFIINFKYFIILTKKNVKIKLSFICTRMLVYTQQGDITIIATLA